MLRRPWIVWVVVVVFSVITICLLVRGCDQQKAVQELSKVSMARQDSLRAYADSVSRLQRSVARGDSIAKAGSAKNDSLQSDLSWWRNAHAALCDSFTGFRAVANATILRQDQILRSAESRIAELSREMDVRRAASDGYQEELQAKADTLDITKKYMAVNLAVCTGGFNEPNSQVVYSSLQNYLNPICEAQSRLIWGPDGKSLRDCAKRLRVGYEDLYRFIELNQLNPCDVPYNRVKQQISDIIRSGSFQWLATTVFGCDSTAVSHAEYVARDIINIH